MSDGGGGVGVEKSDVIENLAVPASFPMYVDLDGTLYPGDTLWDSVALVMSRSPLELRRLPWLIIAGPLSVKRWLAERVVPDASLLPYRVGLIDLCRAERRRGRRVVLATAAHRRIAESVAGYLGCFDAVIASDVTNRKGSAKLLAIREDTEGSSFLYAGDSEADRVIWGESAGVLAAGRAARWDSQRFQASVLARFPDAHSRFYPFLRSLRPHQWVKNILVFVPLVTSHRFLDKGAVVSSVLIFVAFCLCASSAYLLNDIVDLENDRAHHRKKRRPIAAGTLPVSLAIAFVPVLLALSVVVASTTTTSAMVCALIYYVLTVAYSLVLKRLVLVDVFTLACLYALRCCAGNAAAGIRYSPWLLGFMVFLFLSLAFAKRHSELRNLRVFGGGDVKGRGYQSDDLELVAICGVASGFVSALVMGLYVTSDAVSELYDHPLGLCVLSPLVLFWICRVWFISHRGQLHYDPIVFALRDRMSYLFGLVVLVILVASSGWWV